MNILDYEVAQKFKEKKFSCQICEKKFASRNGLYDHHKTKHDESNPNKCKICLQLFASKSQLDAHSRVHTGEKPFVCSTCGKQFATKFSLDVHSRVHTGEKPFVCSTCGMGFTNQYTMRRHTATHSVERKHRCAICPVEKSFKTKAQLSIHMRRHSDPKYHCKQCKKKFYTSSNLKRHEKTHVR